MDKDELVGVLERGPVRITMNDGSQHLIEDASMTLCSDIMLDFLRLNEEDGRYYHVFLPLVTMARVELLTPAG